MKSKNRSKKKPITKKTPTKKLDNKLKLLTELINNIPDVIYIKDRKGKLLLVNKAHAKGLGLSPEKVKGKTDFDFFPKARAKIMAKDDNHVLKTGKPIIDLIERGTRADGVDNYVSTTKIPWRDKAGKTIGLMGITRDITARMNLLRLRDEKEQIIKRLKILEEMTKMKSEFLSVVSHELNTPLIIVQEAISLVIDGVVGTLTKRQKELLFKATSNLERLKRMIDDLLDFSRLEKHKLTLHYSLVNFNELLFGSSEFFAKWAKEKNIKLQYKLAPKQINIFIDPERVSQVVSNLINNAIKYTEQNGQIRVEVDVLEDKVRVAIIDSGIGIAKSDLAKLFKKFSQVTASGGFRRKGVGLGLSISKELIEKHGGEIWVESKVGVGSKFYFTLPRFYTAKPLDKQVRVRINRLLDKRISLYLINILLVNFNIFKKRITVKPRKLFKDLKDIINNTLDEHQKKDKEKPQVILEGYQRGEWSILFPETKEGEAVKICSSLKERIKKYFLSHRVKGVFINLGIMSYFQKDKDPTTGHILANLHVKRIAIGSEIRKYRRMRYRANIDVILPGNKVKASQAVDISAGGIAFAIDKSQTDTVDMSEGGIAFQINEPLSTDARIAIILRPENRKIQLKLDGRVAWVKPVEETVGGKVKKYFKVGVEFSKLNDKGKKKIMSLISSIKQTKSVQQKESKNKRKRGENE
mgnify:CR=1 FL=1